MVPNRAWKSGRISFPIFPTIVVIAVLAVLASLQFPKQAPRAATEYALENADIHGTQIKPIDDKQIDFVIYLSPSGVKRVAGWLAAKPDSEITVSYGDKILGKTKLTSTMDPTIIHLSAPTDNAMMARYVIGK